MKNHLAHLLIGESLSLEDTADAFEQIMNGQASPAQVGALLAMMQMRGPAVDEITGAARVMRQKATAVKVPDGLTVVDTCGTGGDHSAMFNVSTAAALVVAAAGRPQNVAVAKHGNRSITSQSGSSQVLEEFGIKLNVAPTTLTRCLDEAGICFCFAPTHHPAMKHAMPIRMDLGFRTIFNVLGPLTNPARASRQLIGVFDADLTEPIARVLAALGSEQAMVVHGLVDGHGIDEMSIFGPTRVSHLREGNVHSEQIDPTALGLNRGGAGLEAVQVDSPAQSAALIRDVLTSNPGGGDAAAAREMVCLNAAAALVVAQVSANLEEGLLCAAEVLESGKVTSTLDKLRSITQSDPTG